MLIKIYNHGQLQGELKHIFTPSNIFRYIESRRFLSMNFREF